MVKMIFLILIAVFFIISFVSVFVFSFDEEFRKKILRKIRDFRSKDRILSVFHLKKYIFPKLKKIENKVKEIEEKIKILKREINFIPEFEEFNDLRKMKENLIRELVEQKNLLAEKGREEIRKSFPLIIFIEENDDKEFFDIVKRDEIIDVYKMISKKITGKEDVLFANLQILKDIVEEYDNYKGLKLKHICNLLLTKETHKYSLNNKLKEVFNIINLQDFKK